MGINQSHPTVNSSLHRAYRRGGRTRGLMDREDTGGLGAPPIYHPLTPHPHQPPSLWTAQGRKAVVSLNSQHSEWSWTGRSKQYSTPSGERVQSETIQDRLLPWNNVPLTPLANSAAPRGRSHVTQRMKILTWPRPWLPGKGSPPPSPDTTQEHIPTTSPTTLHSLVLHLLNLCACAASTHGSGK